MKYPNLNEEQRLWRKGYKKVICLDESGRGPLAGPVVAAALMIKNSKFESRNSKQIQIFKFSNFQNSSDYLDFSPLKVVSDLGFPALDLKIRDSKKLTPKARNKLYKILTTCPTIEWGIGKVSEKVIDKINVLEATKLAMKRAIWSLVKKLRKKGKEYCPFCNDKKVGIIDFLILDGNFKIDLPFPQRSIVKADEKVFSCTLASILAKVTRDRIMQKYAKKYPQYGFDRHKGYPTELHLKMLKRYGSCRIHRKSFKSVKKTIDKKLGLLYKVYQKKNKSEKIELLKESKPNSLPFYITRDQPKVFFRLPLVNNIKRSLCQIPGF